MKRGHLDSHQVWLCLGANKGVLVIANSLASIVFNNQHLMVGYLGSP
jgi:hypothetical protein